MLQTFRLAVLSLLLLLQLFAPLVHAHAGGGPVSGMLHVPGLEFLGKPDGSAAEPAGGQPDTGQLIVGMAPGLKNPGACALPASASGFPPATPASAPGFKPPTAASPLPPGPLAIARLCWLAPATRAPPPAV